VGGELCYGWGVGTVPGSIRAIALGLGFWLVGCSVPLVENLDEGGASEVVVALTEAQIGATKERDAAHEGRFQVLVERDDVPTALVVLEGVGLPERDGPDVLEALGEGALVPSRTAERARYLAGTSGELERSLRDVTGVLSARVHLSVPERDPLSNDTASLPTASVLLRHNGATPPLSVEDVRRLVSGAVSGLRPEAVAVVLHPVTGAPKDKGDRLTQLGPLSLARSSATKLRWLLGTAGGLNVLLAVALVFVWLRLRRSREREGKFNQTESPS
jgi:type III secretion protein J